MPGIGHKEVTAVKDRDVKFSGARIKRGDVRFIRNGKSEKQILSLSLDHKSI